MITETPLWVRMSFWTISSSVRGCSVTPTPSDLPSYFSGSSVTSAMRPTPSAPPPDWRDEVDQVYAALRAAGLTLLNEPVAWPVDRFFDTRYHLRRDAAARRTDELVPELAAWMDG